MGKKCQWKCGQVGETQDKLAPALSSVSSWDVFNLAEPQLWKEEASIVPVHGGRQKYTWQGMWYVYYTDNNNSSSELLFETFH
jgi:hypothetical protein